MDYRVELPEPITEISGDKAYPIFRVESHLRYDGCAHDYVGSSRMYREMPSAELLIKDMDEWLASFLNKEPLGKDKTPIVRKHPIIQHIRVVLKEYETWCIRWFSHYTYVEGKTDDELLQSFYRFRERKLPLHLKEEYCLMGAEDSWRIKKPCRCDDCLKLGITRILH
ncbi:hypothetical protein LCGC14_0543780 [marine sediment metagenome]|uniref:Uncharacterized protein n=1 Tax=marine sediment metagenome TaxID=412755 RepID=A0A0F9RWV1_9ZZZZ